MRYPMREKKLNLLANHDQYYIKTSETSGTIPLMWMYRGISIGFILSWLMPVPSKTTTKKVMTKREFILLDEDFRKRMVMSSHN